MTQITKRGHEPEVGVILQQFQQQWNFDGVYVADAALYSADNLAQLGTLLWISRVPLTLTQASDLIEEIDESAFRPTQMEGFALLKCAAPMATSTNGG